MLFDPIDLAGATAKNRIMISPMCQYKSQDGHPTPWHQAHIGRFALGGAGIVFVEETAVEPDGRRTYACSGIWSDEHVNSFRALVDIIHSGEALAGLQIGHAGLKGSCADVNEDWRRLVPSDAAHGQPPWTTIGPSISADFPASAREMSVRDIADNVELWGAATRRAALAGFDVLEIHAAHGALLHQFLSSSTNLRTDEYGGPLRNRARFLIEVVRSVRREWPPNLPLFLRLSMVDGAGGSWSLEDSVAVARWCKDEGVTVVDCSSGGNGGSSVLARIPRVPGYHVPYAARIRHAVGVPTVVVGRIRSAAHAERILAAGHGDIIALARDAIEYADWPIRAHRELTGNLYALYPESYAFRLVRRDRERAMTLNSTFPAAIPIGENEQIVFHGPDEIV